MAIEKRKNKMNINPRIKLISSILGGILAISAIFSGAYTGMFRLDSRYAKAAEFKELRSDFNEKKLQDEIFQLKLMITQENIFNGGEDSNTLTWMKNELETKQLKLKTLIERSNENVGN